MELFSRKNIVGVFRGFREGGLEFRADLALPYQTFFQNIPMHGQLLLVQLETPDEAVLGRITSLSSEGKLSGSVGEDFNIRALREDRTVPEQLRRDYLKYRVTMRILGVVRNDEDEIRFVPSHRRLPHVGSPVAFLGDELAIRLLGNGGSGSPIGVFALGEYVYGSGNSDLRVEPWMQLKEPGIPVRFAVTSMVARRTFVFARAGFGKSNLNKLLFSKLYEVTPTVVKRGERAVPVGTVIFDPDGEYFWPDDKGRPGLCDVPALEDKLVVFTSKEPPSAFYGSFVAGGIKLDIRRLQPADVISIAVSPEKQDMQNVRKLRGMNPTDWATLVDLISHAGNSADLGKIQQLLHLETDQSSEALAARANMTAIVRGLHDSRSQLMDMLIDALGKGKLCVIDVSQLRGGPSLILSGLILRRIFDRNQEEFTKAVPKTIPTIAVVEEAQSVLNERASASTPYIEWVKEGRKYDLGAVLITQQPGSIPTEILSQGDNWFIFHMLSAADLQNVQRANAHFSDDLLSALLNEPIPGQGVMWSAVSGTPFPISMRVNDFEALYQRRDPRYKGGPINTFAAQLREEFQLQSEAHLPLAFAEGDSSGGSSLGDIEEGTDVFRVHQVNATEALRANAEFQTKVVPGIPYGKVVGILREALPSSLDNRDSIAYNLVPTAVTAVLGPQGEYWTTERRGPKNTTFIKAVKQQS